MKAMPVMAGRCCADVPMAEERIAAARSAANLMGETVAGLIRRVKKWKWAILNVMKKTAGPKKPVRADAIAETADEGRDVSRFFTNSGRMIGERFAATADASVKRDFEAGAMDGHITEAITDRTTGKTRAL